MESPSFKPTFKYGSCAYICIHACTDHQTNKKSIFKIKRMKKACLCVCVCLSISCSFLLCAKQLEIVIPSCPYIFMLKCSVIGHQWKLFESQSR